MRGFQTSGLPLAHDLGGPRWTFALRHPASTNSSISLASEEKKGEVPGTPIPLYCLCVHEAQTFENLRQKEKVITIKNQMEWKL